MTLVLRWRTPKRALVTRWRGPEGMAEAIGRHPEAPIAAIIGPAGRDGASSVVSRTAGEALGGHRGVAIHSDGLAYHASPGDGWEDAVAGITTGAASSGAAASIIANGEVTEAGWNWTPGPVWLGASGTLTQTVPTTGALVRMGTALGPTTMFVEPRLIARL